MLKCRDVVEQTSDYVDDELNWRQRLSFRMHIILCGRCRAFVSNFRKMLLILHKPPASPIPPKLIEKLEQQISKRLDEKTSDNG